MLHVNTFSLYIQVKLLSKYYDRNIQMDKSLHSYTMFSLFPVADVFYCQDSFDICNDW